MEELTAALNNPELTSPLKEDYKRLSKQTISDLFNSDSNRFDNFFVQCGDLRIDFSKNKVDLANLSHLCALAKHSDLHNQQKALFSGSKVNNTEKRAALHTALRAPQNEIPEKISQEVSSAINKLKLLADKICKNGKYKVCILGHSHKSEIDTDKWFVDDRIYANAGYWCGEKCTFVETEKNSKGYHVRLMKWLGEGKLQKGKIHSI